MSDCISREELTKKLEYLCDCLCEYSKRQREVMCDSCKLGAVIDAVEEMPSVTPQPEKRTEERTKTHACDCISREAAFDEIIWNSDNGVIDEKVAIEALRNLPSVEPERKPGKWIDEGQYADGHSAHAYRCSKCGGHIIECRPDDFCRHCGADMREVDNGRTD